MSQELALATRRDALRQGVIAAIAAYGIWGLVPLFFRQLAHVPADEIIAHRVLWSLLLMAAVLLLTRGFGDAWGLARQPARLARVALASAMVMANWLTFVYGINAGRILETSLGYFILPLFNVALGVLVLKERLRPLQWLAVALATAGVANEAAHLGGLPWISLVLAGSFGLYGLLRKQLPLDAASGLFLETACMAPFAVLWLVWRAGHGGNHFGLDLGSDLLLVATGVVTAVPLLLFAVAARRLPLTLMGFLQYLAPTLSFLLAIFVYHEPMPASRLITFAAIWTGLVVYSVDLLRAPRAP